jgi:hypothetical protein
MMLSDKDKFVLQLSGPAGRAEVIRKLAKQHKEVSDDIAWVISNLLERDIPDAFENLTLSDYIYIVLDQECDKSYYGLHEVEINPNRLVFPPKSLRCRFCDKDVDINESELWQYPYTS